MKVAIPCHGNSWDSQLSPMFGNAPCFFIIDERRAHVQVIRHPSPHSDDPGQVVLPFLVQAGVQLVITGDCSQVDIDRLDQAGVRLMRDIQGTVDLVYRRVYHGLLGSPCEALVQ